MKFLLIHEISFDRVKVITSLLRQMTSLLRQMIIIFSCFGLFLTRWPQQNEKLKNWGTSGYRVNFKFSENVCK